ncbi:hypothetical protein Adt_31871 [Abeliophyllum distichum]|uniref:Uncharacterized protein n=1 Tax=Abeliophyllum distichum TaxID=126358 RepID=A0ABD1RFF6_9LAMI
MDHCFVQRRFPLGLSHLAACSAQGAQLRSRASPTRTRPPSSFLLLGSTTSLKGLSHWDSATYQLAPPKERSFVQGPPPLGLGHLTAHFAQRVQIRSRASLNGTRATYQLAPPREHSFAQGPLPLGLGHLPTCSAQGAQLRSSFSPTGTRPPNSSLRPKSTDSLKGLSHWDSSHLPTCSS